MFSLNQNQRLLWLTLIWERDCLTGKKKRKLRPVQAERKVLSTRWEAIIYKMCKLCKLVPLLSRCWMASNNEMVISLQGKLFRVTQCSITHPVTHLPPSPGPGSHRRWKKPQGRSVVICCPLDSFILICGFLHCREWTSPSHPCFSNLHLMALKNQKHVFHISQMHQHLDLGKPKWYWLAISRSRIAIGPVVSTLVHIICSELKKIIKNPWLLFCFQLKKTGHNPQTV